MVAGLRAGPRSEEEVLSPWFFFSFWVACVCADGVSFVYSVMLSSVCVLLSSVWVDLLQVPGFTALAYVLTRLNCSNCLRASGNDKLFLHFILRIFLSFCHCGHFFDSAE